MTEKLLKQKILVDDENPKSWYSLTVFYLRRQNFDLAETCLNKVFFLQEPCTNLRRIAICFLLRRGRVKQAEENLIFNLEIDKWSLLDNLLMSFFQEKIYDKKLLARKYFNVSRKKYLLQLGTKSSKISPNNEEEL